MSVIWRSEKIAAGKIGAAKTDSRNGRIRRAASAVFETLENRQLMSGVPNGSVKLTGAIVGTPGAYQNANNTIAHAFDGDLTTYVDIPTANGDVMGIAMTTPATVTQIQYAARTGWGSRMVGGFFQGSSSSDFSTGTVTLATIGTAPASGEFTSQPVTAAGSYQYLRYVAPTASYGNVAEVEFDGVPNTIVTPPPPSGTQVTGAVIGTAGSFQNNGNTAANAFDGNLATYFDGPTANGNYTGLNLGTPISISSIAFAPRSTYASRMVGGIFQGSNSADFSTASTLYTVTTAPVTGSLTTVTSLDTTPYQYVRYLAPAGSYGNVAELEFFTPTTTGGPTGTINVHLFNDSNGNGTQDTGEAGLAGFGDYLDLNNNGVFDASDLRMTADANGNITFPNLTAGTYHLMQNVPAGYVITTPTGGYPITVALSAGGTTNVVVGETTATKLTGAVFGTAGSYGNSGNTIAKAFDGSLTTYFDGPTGNGNLLGLNLGAPATLSLLRFSPRPGWAARMVGGVFQGSNTSDFSSGVVTLYTVTTAPSVGVMTTVPISGTYQYVRYVAPAASFGDVAEIEFDGTAGTVVSNPGKLTGTVIGTSGSYGNSGNTIAKAFDGNLTTYFDGPTANNDVVGLNLGSEANLTQLQYSPRAGWASRMIGGVFQASNASDFSSGVVVLYTVMAAPAYGVMTTVPVTTGGPYQYVRYLAPQASYGDVAEIEFDGISTGIVAPPVPNAGQPTILSSNPANGATGIDRTAFVSCAIDLPNVGAGVSIYFLNSSNVYLYRTFDHTLVDAVVNTDGAGGDLVLQPTSPLDANTSYTFVVTSNLEDTSGAHFVPFTSTFTTNGNAVPTDPNIAFTKVPQPTATGQEFTGVVIGPDGDLYASTLTGDVFQFPVAADGTLGNPVDIKTAITANGGPVIITGIAFDPTSTATNMTMWLSIGSGAIMNAPNFSGEIATLSGPNFSVYQNYVVGLPRSNSNHLNEQPVFGPDGALYWSQGSLTSMGAPDSVWGYRNETLLSAAILRLDVNAARAHVAAGLGPINVQTESLPAGQTAYNPYAAGAPLTLYATGIRNAFDLVFDSNGHLYVPTNGASATGNIPGTPTGVTPSAPAETNVPNAEDDYVYDVTQGGYYGHPDPARGQYIFGGGNPINPAANQAIQGVYPVGTLPDPNYRGYAYDIGAHYSPDGSIEYSGSAFGGALNGAILVTRYSGGKDIEVLKTDSSGAITQSETGITGFTSFNDPVDLIEDPRTGYIYVAELGGAGDLMLLKPISSGASASVSTSTVYFNDPTNGSAGPAQSVTITNNGNQPLAIPATGISVTGTDGALFVVVSKPTLPTTIAPGASVTLTIAYNAGTSSLGLHTASLVIQTNDPANPTLTVALRALTTAGLGGTQEPSLQRILDLYQIPDNVGTANPNQTAFTTPPQTPNDEVTMQELQKADPESPVTITPLAAFSATITPSVTFGYYNAGSPAMRTDEFSVTAADSQSVDVSPVGSTTFDPGTGIFGIYTSFDAFPNTNTGTARYAYSEDVFNTYDTTNNRKVRFWPLKNPNGTVVPNAYVFATEDYGVAPNYDSNDFVGIIRNVIAAPGEATIGLQNVDGSTDIEGASFPNQLVFNAIQNPNYPAVPNITHKSSTVRIDNSGTLPLIITAIASSSAAFVLPAGLTLPLTIAAGSSYNLTITYSPTHTGTNAIDTGTLQIVSNDPVKPTITVKLSGLWQSYGNMLPDGTYTEPTVPQIVNTIFGYGTQLTYAGQSINEGGAIQTSGEEVLSQYWVRADTNLPVTVRQLDAFHTQGNAATLYGYPQGKTTSFTKITSSTGADGQSLLPLTNDTTGAPAFGLYYPAGVFGLNVDKSEFSDDTLNVKGSGTDQGHHVRFWPARTSAGLLIPNTWIMAMDYESTGENYDYNDNIYVISNMTPAPPAAPAGVTGTGSVAGVTVAWTAVSDPLLTGYNVLRSTSSTGTFIQINGTLVTGTSFVDTSGTPGTAYFYKVQALDSWGGIGGFSTTVTGTRTKNTTAPAAPINLSANALPSGITLTWNANTEKDLVGYNVYRATSSTGTYFLLNLSPLTSPSYVDSSAAFGSPSYYKVMAVNASGVSSIPSLVNATRPAQTVAPAQPTGFSATGSSTGNNLAWTANTEADLVGYNLYSSYSPTGPFTKINTQLLTATNFSDSTALAGVSTYYEVTAVDSSFLESAPAMTSSTRTATAPTPTGFTATGTAGAVSLAWAANTEPGFTGYLLYRSASATGHFTALNSGNPLTATTFNDTTTVAGNTYFYRLFVLDGSGSESAPATASIAV